MSSDSQTGKGQCPKCWKAVEATDDPSALLVNCDCGASLFACDAIDFDEIPVRCPDCRETFLASPNDIGTAISCDCGLSMVVPDKLMRLPMLTTEAALDEATQPKPAAKAKPAGSPNWLPIVGVTVVVMFFLGAASTFAISRMNSSADSPDSQATNSTISATLTTPDSNRGSRPWAPVSARQWQKITAATELSVFKEPTPSDPIVNVSQPATIDEERSSATSPFGGRTAKRVFKLPPRQEPREWIAPIPIAQQTRFFNSAYQDVFESYEALNALEPKSGKKASGDYKMQLGETLTRAKHAFELSARSDDPKKQNELGYLLAFLSYKAGHLIEASLYGETIARFGDVDDPSTHEALMIALAATQEANSSHWAIPKQVGELHQMETLAELVDQRWPQDPQRDVIWMSLAKSYADFGYSLDAARALLKINKDSSSYQSARLSAGMAHWNHFVDQASVESPDAKQMVGLLRTAEQALSNAIKLGSDGDGPGKDWLVAKLTLAKIAYRLGELPKAERWLTAKPRPLVSSITTSKRNKKAIRVDVPLARAVFDLLYQVRFERNDFVGADKALQLLAGLTSKPDSSTSSQRQASMVISEVKKLLSGKAVSLAQYESLERMLKSANTSSSLTKLMPTANQLWLAESLGTLAERASDTNVAGKCLGQAASIYSSVIAQNDLPKESLIQVTLRYAELLRESGQVEESIAAMKEILKSSPNIIDLQFQVALAQQEVAISAKDLRGLVAVMNGKAEEGIWGWAKLAVNLHGLRYSSSGTETHAQQLMLSQYHLARCGFLASRLTEDSGERSVLQGKARRQVSRILATLPPSSAPETEDAMSQWVDIFTKLFDQMEPG